VSTGSNLIRGDSKRRGDGGKVIVQNLCHVRVINKAGSYMNTESHVSGTILCEGVAAGKWGETFGTIEKQ